MSIVQDTALDAVRAAEAAGNTKAALIVFAALDAHRDSIPASERHQVALDTWFRLVDCREDIHVTDEQFVLLVGATAGHVPDHTVIDLIDGRYGDAPREIRLASGAGLDWEPDRRRADLYWPVLGQIVRHEYHA